ncbi:hypothetical protein [Sorangium sp. So ce1151]|uniref:hypothetical protein n=1 Tax=Sorangium sp. So ce1151 TaxID=3133332 RepID=UPI003F62BB13
MICSARAVQTRITTFRDLRLLAARLEEIAGLRLFLTRKRFSAGARREEGVRDVVSQPEPPERLIGGRQLASESGLSAVEVDAIQAVLECVRALALGRAPQAHVPHPAKDDEQDLINSAALPKGQGFQVPSFGPVNGLAASMQAKEALAWLGGLEHLAQTLDAVVVVDALTTYSTVSSIPHAPACRGCNPASGRVSLLEEAVSCASRCPPCEGSRRSPTSSRCLGGRWISSFTSAYSASSPIRGGPSANVPVSSRAAGRACA